MSSFLYARSSNNYKGNSTNASRLRAIVNDIKIIDV